MFLCMKRIQPSLIEQKGIKMRVVLQRVKEARVIVKGNTVGEISKGYLLLVGVEDQDSEEDIDWLTKKITNMRLFSDENGKMNLSIQKVEGEILSISQFTLFASTKKGNRPSFIKSAKAEFAKKMYDLFNDRLKTNLNKDVQKGIFGADMQVELINDGPVTILLDSKNKE